MSKQGRAWKFVGGPKGPRNSLKAACKAAQEEPQGEKGIFNAETGELYDLLGNPLHVLIKHQHEKTVDMLALVYLTGMLGGPLDPKALVPMIKALGGKFATDILMRAKEMAEKLAEDKKAAQEEAAQEESPDGDS